MPQIGREWQPVKVDRKNDGVANARAKIVQEARPLLNKGEVIAHVVKALEGPNRWLGIGIGMFAGLGVGLLSGNPILGVPIMWIVYTRMYARRILLATDQSLVVIEGGRFRFAPKRVLERLDVDTRIGPLKGLFMTARVNGRRLYIVPRSAGEATAADADVEA